MNRFLNFVFFLFCINSFAQQLPKAIVVKGNVYDREDSTAVEGVTIILKDDKGRNIIRTTDSAGKYFFEIKGNFFSLAEIQCIVTKDVHSKTKGAKYLANDDKGIINLTDTNDLPIIYLKTFSLQKYFVHLPTPRITFKKNSLQIDTSRYLYPAFDEADSGRKIPDYCIDILEHILKENPEIIIELDAHCSGDEKDVDSLSLKRAQKVKELLLAKKVNPKRIEAKGWGIQKQMVTEVQIKKAKNKKEKEELNARNRRCVFKILSWDYVEKKK